MGLVVVGRALLDVSAWYLIWNQFIPNSGMEITAIMLTYGMGASTQAALRRSRRWYLHQGGRRRPPTSSARSSRYSRG